MAFFFWFCALWKWCAKIHSLMSEMHIEKARGKQRTVSNLLARRDFRTHFGLWWSSFDEHKFIRDFFFQLLNDYKWILLAAQKITSFVFEHGTCSRQNYRLVSDIFLRLSFIIARKKIANAFVFIIWFMINNFFFFRSTV